MDGTQLIKRVKLSEAESLQNEEIEPEGDGKRKRETSEKLNHILFVTIHNVKYPITTDVLHAIASPHGRVQRIVIIKRLFSQALIEFDCIESAKRAKQNLQGKSIYTGCCSLEVAFAKPYKLTLSVGKNDKNECWDYTIFKDEDKALLPKPKNILEEEKEVQSSKEATLIDVTPTGKGTVMMVYGLPKEKLNADRLFNLFAQYGNVNCIKFLKNKEDCAMIQMGSAESVDRCLNNFKNTLVFNSKLELAASKQEILTEGGKGKFKLWDDSPSFKSYTGSFQNRFTDPKILSKNRILPPSSVLYFYNVPPKTEVELIRQVFIETGAPAPKSVKIVKNISKKSCSGVAEFSTVGDAVEALALVNYYPLNNPAEGGKPFLMKLRFSWVEKSDRKMNDEENPA